MNGAASPSRLRRSVWRASAWLNQFWIAAPTVSVFPLTRWKRRSRRDTHPSTSGLRRLWRMAGHSSLITALP
jgi:hypothetical protein